MCNKLKLKTIEKQLYLSEWIYKKRPKSTIQSKLIACACKIVVGGFETFHWALPTELQFVYSQLILGLVYFVNLLVCITIRYTWFSFVIL